MQGLPLRQQELQPHGKRSGRAWSTAVKQYSSAKGVEAVCYGRVCTLIQISMIAAFSGGTDTGLHHPSRHLSTAKVWLLAFCSFRSTTLQLVASGLHPGASCCRASSISQLVLNKRLVLLRHIASSRYSVSFSYSQKSDPAHRLDVL